VHFPEFYDGGESEGDGADGEGDGADGEPDDVKALTEIVNAIDIARVEKDDIAKVEKVKKLVKQSVKDLAYENVSDIFKRILKEIKLEKKEFINIADHEIWYGIPQPCYSDYTDICLYRVHYHRWHKWNVMNHIRYAGVGVGVS